MVKKWVWGSKEQQMLGLQEKRFKCRKASVYSSVHGILHVTFSTKNSLSVSVDIKNSKYISSIPLCNHSHLLCMFVSAYHTVCVCLSDSSIDRLVRVQMAIGRLGQGQKVLDISTIIIHTPFLSKNAQLITPAI